MSELETLKGKEIYDEIKYYVKGFEPEEVDDKVESLLSTEYYLKPEVDKVIAGLREALERQKNAYQRDTGIICKAMNPGVPCAEMKKVMEENESLKDQLLDAKRDACRFEKAMYRALFNWAHVRTFVYMKEHGMLPLGITPDNLEIPPQWRRALDLCKLGYEFANIMQDKLPKKPKASEDK